MKNETSIQQYPLRKPIRNVAGKWHFADAEAYAEHLKSFQQTAERNDFRAHSSEVEVFAIFEDFRVLIATADPLAVTRGMQIFIPATPL